MPMPDIPEDIRRIADARRAARIARVFGEADRLKTALETAGWKVIDDGIEYRLAPLHPPDVVVGGRTRHSWSGSVPSRAAEPAVGIASLVLVTGDRPDALERALAGLAGVVGEDVQRIIVANAPSDELEARLVEWEANSAEVVWLGERLGAAPALNAGIRRASAGVVILLDPSAEPMGDFVTPLVRALADPAVAAAGPWGLVSDDGRRFARATGAAASDRASVAAIDLAAFAFRRADYAERGPLDEHFESPVLLDAWWSMVLRDDEREGAVRGAVIVDVPLVRHEAPVRTKGPRPDNVRDERRNRYRIIDRFGDPRRLAVPGPGRPQ